MPGSACLVSEHQSNLERALCHPGTHGCSQGVSRYSGKVSVGVTLLRVWRYAVSAIAAAVVQGGCRVGYGTHGLAPSVRLPSNLL